MTTMLAARLHKVGEPMKLERVPEPRPTDVLIAPKACSAVPNLINVLTHWQTWFPELPLRKLPAIFGLDVAGVVAGPSLVLDEGEPIRLKPFDAVVQRAVGHSWLNTGREPALLVAVMVGGK